MRCFLSLLRTSVISSIAVGDDVDHFNGTRDGKSDPTAMMGDVGKIEIKSVGTAVGTSLGIELGTLDGTLDGTLLGIALGTPLGTSLGELEGTIDVASAANSVPR